MILTKCAVCATELGLSLGKKCGRCSTRYCGPECQKQHWEGGGHDKLCKPIKKAGGAEQYNANKKYAEAVAAAAEKCADDTKGQTCFICTQALHWKTKEGLVRGCSCRGTAGFVHVSCLAEQAKILVAEAEENNLGAKGFNERWARWDHCSLCKQQYHGVVACALGWACWKTYVGRTEADRGIAMSRLGVALSAAGHHAEALSVKETELAMMRRLRASEENVLAAQGNLASTYDMVGRNQQALQMRRDIYSGYIKLEGEEHLQTLVAAENYTMSLINLERFEEAKVLMHKTIPVARRVLGENHGIPLEMRSMYAQALCRDPAATLDDLREAVTMLEETTRIARRVMGGAHPVATGIELSLRNARSVLAASEAGEDVVSKTLPPG